MNINVIQHSNKTTLALSGRLDAITSPKLQEVLIPAFSTTSHIELDMSEVAYISSAGLRILLLGEKTSKTHDSKQTLINVSAEIMEVFEMTGFSDILSLE